MKLKILVTKDCIMNGKKNDGNSCPIKLAVLDIFPMAFVDGESIYPEGWISKVMNITHQNHVVAIPLPEDAKDFILWFDEKTSYKSLIAMTEFEFEIDIPEEIISKINIDELRPLLTNHKNLKLV